MTANDNSSYVGCLNKLSDEYNNSQHQSVDKKMGKYYCQIFVEELELRY